MRFIPILFFLSSYGYANSIELLYGSYTYHLIVTGGVERHFVNKVSNDGKLINNALYGIRFNERFDNSYRVYTLFHGENTIGEPMRGFSYSSLKMLKYVDLGFIIGAYMQDNDKYVQKGIDNFRLTNGPNGLVPIIGLEVNMPVMLSRTIYLKLNNIITPILTNHSLSFGKTF